MINSITLEAFTMKTRISFAVLWFFNYLAYSQLACDFFDDYSDPAPWTNVYIYPGIAPCSLDPQTGTLEVTGGEVVFTNVNDGNDTRIHRDLGFTLSDDAWTANFDFKSTDIGEGLTPRVGHVIFALSAGTNCPFNDSTYHCDISDQDGITVWYLSEYDPVPSTTGFYIYAKDGTSWVSSWGIDWVTAEVGQQYYLTLKRIATDFVTLDVYTDPDRTILEGSIECFEIPDDITDLNVLQHGNAPWGFYLRTLTGTMDNTCIYDNITETAFIIGPDSVCSSEIAEYSISSGAGSIEWDLPLDVTYSEVGSNTIEITDWGGLSFLTISAEITTDCQTSTVTFDVFVAASISISETFNICENDTIYVFGAAVSDAGIFIDTIPGIGTCDSIHTIIVNMVDTIETSETILICINDTIFIDGIPVSDPGTYFQSFISINGCDSIHTIVVETQDTIFTTESITICYGESALIFGNTETEPGDYYGYFNSINGCDSVHTINLLVQPPIEVDFIADTLVTDGTGIILDPIITGVSSSISWFPSTSLTCDDCLNPSAFPTESGWYYITVIDANGCTSLDSIYILVDFDFTILAPNAFSPNGDGINDEFNVFGSSECDLIYLRIYNRWGALIFESIDINIGWDGIYNNIEQEIGTYVYVAEGNCDGVTVQLTGTITLVR